MAMYGTFLCEWWLAAIASISKALPYNPCRASSLRLLHCSQHLFSSVFTLDIHCLVPDYWIRHLRTNMASSRLPKEAYAIGIICALFKEKAAVEAMLDEEHPALAQRPEDTNSYTFGKIGEHNVVVACLPEGYQGKAAAAAVAIHMKHSFPIKLGLMVGIGGGVPSQIPDVRLGDVVVSLPLGTHGGVIQYDLGKMESDGFRRKGHLDKPPKALLGAVTSLRATHEFENNQHLVREPRADNSPQVFYGTIGSGDLVMKNSDERDRLAADDKIICFEMEAAGLMNDFPCLVIRGISDYADSRKNDRWQPYAAATAAAYAKELLSAVSVQEVEKLGPASTNATHQT
jgi:nucleoside phosphorylase